MANRQPSLRRDFRSPLLASRAAASQVSADASRDPRDAWSAPDSDREVVWTEPGCPRAHRRGPLPRRQRRPPKTKESFSRNSPKYRRDTKRSRPCNYRDLEGGPLRRFTLHPRFVKICHLHATASSEADKKL